MRAKQSVEGRPYAPFLSMCANCFLWTTYGLLFRDPTIIMTNGVGLALSLYYIYAYFSAAKLAERVKHCCSSRSCVVVAHGWRFSWCGVVWCA
jgi:hypothetical protein